MSARAIRSKSPLRICISKALAAGTRQQKSHTPLAMMAIQGESSCISRLDHAQKTLSIFRRGSGTASAHCLFNQSSKRCQPWQMIFFTDRRHCSRCHGQRQVWPWFFVADFFEKRGHCDAVAPFSRVLRVDYSSTSSRTDSP